VLRPSVPTGNGFCLYIRRDCLEATGGLDEAAFPRGYGEENDFCMRAGRIGWRHLIDDRTIVFHARSASFGAEKARLLDNARDVLAERYPEYSVLTRAFHGGALDTVRHRVRRLFDAPAGQGTGSARILYVISTVTGGTPQTNADLMRGLRGEADTWLLRCDGRAMELSHVTDGGSRQVAAHTLAERIRPTDAAHPEYDRVLLGWLVEYGFELVHVRHLAWHSLGLTTVCRQLAIPVVMSLHDFYMICPTVNLLNGEGRFCAADCTSSDRECHVPLWPEGSVPPLRDRWIARWRAMAGAVLADCARLVVTSEYARRLFAETYPAIADRLVTIPHGRDTAGFRADIATPPASAPIRILVPGNISEAKGSKVIRALRDCDTEGRLEFHILGTADPALTGPRITFHGPYAREDFAARVAGIAPAFGAIFSIWPETYCHTLTEMWSLGLPVFAFDMGAVGERIHEWGGGWFVPQDDVARLRDAILAIANDPDRRRQAVREIVAWQDGEGTSRTVAAMARDYMHLYAEVVRGRKAFAPRALTVGLVCPAADDLKSANGSTHVRLWERTRDSLFRSLRYVRLRPDDLQPALEAGRLDLVLVQRNALPDRLIGPALSAMKAADVPLVLELDDNLLSAGPAVDGDGFHRLRRAGLERLLLEAELLICSTPELGRALRTDWQAQRILPNGLSPRLWHAPLPAMPDAGPLGASAPGEVRVLFAGTATHRRDIAMLEPAFRVARGVHPGLRLIVAGAFDRSSDWFDAIPVPDESRDYPAYVTWLRGLSAHVDFGIAPLEASEFNAAKSGLKFLEYAGCGLTGLFSDADPYRRLVEASGTGRCVANDTSAWAEALIAAATRVEAMRGEGETARGWAHANGMLDLTALDGLLGDFARERTRRVPVLAIAADAPGVRVLRPTKPGPRADPAMAGIATPRRVKS
jgi:glycosyltransferase involved in cell wall biosynthesis